MRRLTTSGALAPGCLLLAAACSSAPPGYVPQPGSSSAISAVLGARSSYTPGEVIGGRGARAQRIVQAGIKAVPEGEVGAYMDRQEAELRRQTAGTGVDLIRQGDELLLRMPSGITFDVGSYALKPQFERTIREIAFTLNNYPATMIDVLGHTDSTGSDSVNQRLSEQRARAVADSLAARRVARARLATRGHGETMPIGDNATEAGRAANRRVEIKLVPASRSDLRG